MYKKRFYIFPFEGFVSKTFFNFACYTVLLHILENVFTFWTKNCGRNRRKMCAYRLHSAVVGCARFSDCHLTSAHVRVVSMHWTGRNLWSISNAIQSLLAYTYTIRIYFIYYNRIGPFR